MRVICFSGKAGSGKDTSAGMFKQILQDNGSKVLLIHYADLLKFICRAFFGWNGEKDASGRTLLQHVGTDVVRKETPDYWVDFIADMLRRFPEEWEYVLIPDARFPNEIDVLRERGFDVTHVRVVRDGHTGGLTGEQMAHASETSLDDVQPDITIINDGSLEGLEQQIQRTSMGMLVGHQITIEEWVRSNVPH